MKSPITTHVLDTMLGSPAAGIQVTLEMQSEVKHWNELARGITNQDGRISDLLPVDRKLSPGVYRLTFQTGKYYEDAGVNGFYPQVQILFELREPVGHYHLPLLLSPFGYSTYRGS